MARSNTCVCFVLLCTYVAAMHMSGSFKAADQRILTAMEQQSHNYATKMAAYKTDDEVATVLMLIKEENSLKKQAYEHLNNQISFVKKRATETFTFQNNVQLHTLTQLVHGGTLAAQLSTKLYILITVQCCLVAWHEYRIAKYRAA
eukprot:SAG31_NODE_3687_length_3987_cov_4.811214_1_plen_146_part_00